MHKLILFIFFISTVVSCSSECGNEILKQEISPGKSFVATLFERNCGATTSFSQVVILSMADDEFNGDQVENYIFSMVGNYNIDLKWKNNTQLVISRPNIDKDIFKNESLWNGITIIYEN